MKQEDFYTIDHTNKKWFWSHLDTEKEVNEVCKYLQKNNLIITVIPYGEGNKVMLEGVDLTGNAYCRVSKIDLLNHVRYFRKLVALSNTKVFKNWIKNYKQFDVVRRYAVEKDQRWLSENGIRAALKLPKIEEKEEF